MRLLLYIAVLVTLASAVVWVTHSAHTPPVVSNTDKGIAGAGIIVVEQVRLMNDVRQLPHYWASEPDSAATNSDRSTLNYVATVDLAVPEFELWSIYIPDVLHDVQIELNGNIIGRALKPPLFSRTGLRTKYIPLPGGALITGTNTLSIRVTAKPARKALLGKLYIGRASILQPLHEARVFQHQMLWFAAVALLLIGLIAIVLSRSSKGDRVYSWFGAMCMAWLLAMISQLLTHSPIDWQWIELIGSLARISFICISYLFCLSFIGKLDPIISRIVLALGVIAAASYTADAIFQPASTAHLQVTIGALQALGFLVAYRFIRQTISDPTEDLFIMATAGALILGFGVHDTYMGFVSEAPVVRYLNYLTPMLFVIAGYILLRRFSRTLKRLDLEEAVTPKPTQALATNSTGARRILVAERERIMRDMHDGVGGHLVSSLSILRNHNISDPDLEEALSQALVDLRLMIDSLEETDGDLSVAVAMLKDRTQRALKGSATQTTWRIEEVVLPNRGPADTLQILRIVQESISNVLKHADAEQLAVSARMANPELAHFCIHDDGKGFDTDATRAGRGLLNLRRRAEALGAELEISSSASGTRIDLWVPNAPSPDATAS